MYCRVVYCNARFNTFYWQSMPVCIISGIVQTRVVQRELLIIIMIIVILWKCVVLQGNTWQTVVVCSLQELSYCLCFSLSLSHSLPSSISLSLSPSGNCIAILLLILGGKRLSDQTLYLVLKVSRVILAVSSLCVDLDVQQSRQHYSAKVHPTSMLMVC